MKTIKREIEDGIEQCLMRGNVIAIAGPSKCGKTTLLRSLFKKAKEKSAFYDFGTEDMKNGVIAEIKPCGSSNHLLNLCRLGNFVYGEAAGSGASTVFIDNFPNDWLYGSCLVECVQRLRRNVRFVIVYNKAVYRKEFLDEHFMAWHEDFIAKELHPLNYGEILSARDEDCAQWCHERYGDVFSNSKTNDCEGEFVERLKMHFSEYLIYGGYPEVVGTGSHDEKVRLLQDICRNSMLSHGEGNEELLKLLAFRMGVNLRRSPFELDALLLGSNQPLWQKLWDLDQDYMCNGEIANESPSFVREIHRLQGCASSVYFYDTGVRNALVGDFRSVEERLFGRPWRLKISGIKDAIEDCSDIGALVRNGVFMELRRAGYFIRQCSLLGDFANENGAYSREDNAINDWKWDRFDAIDFIARKGNRKLAIKVAGPGEVIEEMPESFFLANPDFVPVYLYWDEFPNFSCDGSSIVLPCWIPWVHAMESGAYSDVYLKRKYAEA